MSLYQQRTTTTSRNEIMCAETLWGQLLSASIYFAYVFYFFLSLCGLTLKRFFPSLVERYIHTKAPSSLTAASWDKTCTSSRIKHPAGGNLGRTVGSFPWKCRPTECICQNLGLDRGGIVVTHIMPRHMTVLPHAKTNWINWERIMRTPAVRHWSECQKIRQGGPPCNNHFSAGQIWIYQTTRRVFVPVSEGPWKSVWYWMKTSALWGPFLHGVVCIGAPAFNWDCSDWRL